MSPPALAAEAVTEPDDGYLVLFTGYRAVPGSRGVGADSGVRRCG